MSECKWTRDCCKELTAAGAIIIPHVMGKMASHTPDRSVIWTGGNFFVEFKGLRTPWRDGQRILAGRINSRYPCCFLYREPGYLFMMDKLIGNICAISEPRRFLEALVLAKPQ
jgi:hypothetical protein